MVYHIVLLSSFAVVEQRVDAPKGSRKCWTPRFIVCPRTWRSCSRRTRYSERSSTRRVLQEDSKVRSLTSLTTHWLFFFKKILQINTRAAIRSDAPMRCWTLSCLLGYREWSKQRLLRRLLEVETVREIVTNCPCKHRLSDFEELSRPWRLLSPPIRGWRTAADTPTQPNAEADWSRGSRPCPLRCRGLPWQQRQCSPWERWLRKWRRSLAWKTFLANWRRRGQSFNKHCHIKSEQAATLIIIH